jgi:hypothetical protein
MDLTTPLKDTIWQAGLERKTQQSVAYRRLISFIETSTGWGWKAGRIFTKSIVPETGRGSKTYLKQSKLQTYIDQMR